MYSYAMFTGIIDLIVSDCILKIFVQEISLLRREPFRNRDILLIDEVFSSK